MPDDLLAGAPEALQRLDLHDERLGEFVEGGQGDVGHLLRLTPRQTGSHFHQRHVDGAHLRRKHAFDPVGWLNGLDQGECGGKPTLIHALVLRDKVGQLTEIALKKSGSLVPIDCIVATVPIFSSAWSGTIAK